MSLNLEDFFLENQLSLCHEHFNQVPSREICRPTLLWSKITLISGGVGHAGVDPPSWKTDTFFLGSLALNVPIYRIFQSNGAKWRSFKHWTKKYSIPYYTIFFFFNVWDYSRLFGFIWLEISINWHTKSQGGPKKKCIRFSRGRINLCPAHTACN